ncbi:hypothetical protein AVEN_85622-1 [Araneus ventricosus]|uniref:Mos1 transposase HTH domain-containing protein n=1 Tax=Araneus ventricosus TaxID=182803 RepID=A0A4Y2NLS7_ARAVE|nr:hypothetical protein AVEN_85622-1 [Araneus ventricosus]
MRASEIIAHCVSLASRGSPSFSSKRNPLPLKVHQKGNLLPYEVESINSRNGRLHSRRCSLEGKYFLEVGSTNTENIQPSRIRFQYCRPFLTKRIFHSSDFEITSLEQRENIKFCVFLDISPSETLEMLKKAYGNDAMKKMAVYEWHERFREGRTNIEDDPRTCRPSFSTAAENVESVREIAKQSIKNFT